MLLAEKGLAIQSCEGYAADTVEGTIENLYRLFAPEHLAYQIRNLLDYPELEGSGEISGRARLDLVTADND